MFLSNLLINTGDNPDRPRPGRLWLRNRYRVHQRLWMGFHSHDQKDKDPDFLKPFDPRGFPHIGGECRTEYEPGRKCPNCEKDHGSRTEEQAFLFRIDPLPGGNAMILVQSAGQPDWDYAFQNARYLLAAPPAVKEFSPGFEAGSRLQFRLFANPVKQAHKNSKDKEGKPLDPKWITKDVPDPDLSSWLARRAEPLWSKRPKPEPVSFGFSLVDFQVTQAGYVYVNPNGNKDSGRRVRSALYEGLLEVTDPNYFRDTIIRGIGPGKGFGFGLLSVARA